LYGEKASQQHRHDEHEENEDNILAFEERHCADVNLFGNTLHQLAARRLTLEREVDGKRNQKADNAGNRRKGGKHLHNTLLDW